MTQRTMAKAGKLDMSQMQALSVTGMAWRPKVIIAFIHAQLQPLHLHPRHRARILNALMRVR